MKHIYFLVITLIFVTFAKAQPCTISTNLTQPNTVVFTPPANYPSPQYYCHWDFGDGASIYANTITHIFTIQGNYTISLDVYDSTNTIVCSSNTTLSLTFCDTYFQQDSLNPATFNFWANLVPSNAIAEWNFGDSTSANGANVSHTYTTQGTYTVTMTQYDSTGLNIVCNTSFMVSYNFLLPCSFNIFQPNPLTAPYIFTLNALVASSQGTVTWDVGDSTMPILSGYNMQVGYGNPGTYTICMYYVNGTDSCQYCQQVVVNPGTNCSFLPIPDTTNSLNYSFYASQAGANTSYIWDFGDGSVDTSGIQASHLYSAFGTYLVCLTIIDTQTSVVLCSYCMPVNVMNTQVTCQANFTSVNIGLNAYFINQSVAIALNVPPVQPPVYYLWDFGDGNTSTLQFPQHQYTLPGYYMVCLNVTTVGCNSTWCDSVVIDTNIVNPSGCTALFVFTQTAAYQVVGVNLSSGTNLNFAWDFGDGSLGTGAYPSHQYTTTGTFIVCLTVSDFLGCTDTYCDTLTVDSLGNILYKGASAGFVLNILSPAQVTSGIADRVIQQISGVYPVPANEYVNVEFTLPVTQSIPYEIINSEGSIIISGTFSAKTNRINTRDISDGIYLLRILGTGESAANRRFIKH